MYSLLQSVSFGNGSWSMNAEDIIISYKPNHFHFSYGGDDSSIKNLVISFSLQLLYELEDRQLYDYRVDYHMGYYFSCDVYVSVGYWPINKWFLPVNEDDRMKQIAEHVEARTFRSVEILIAQSVTIDLAECAFMEFV